MAYVRNCFVVGSLGAALSLAAPARTQTQGEAAPTFERDSSWPKPLPNNWVIGIVWGVDVGPNDHDEAYVANGYLNRRVAVYDATTGELQAALGTVWRAARRRFRAAPAGCLEWTWAERHLSPFCARRECGE